MKRILLAMALVALLAGCGSAVKLDDVAVVDKSGTPVAGQGSGAAGNVYVQAGNANNEVNYPSFALDASSCESSLMSVSDSHCAAVVST